MQKVLVIDDFEPVRKVVKRIVERMGYTVLQASHGREGLEIYDKERPEIIITDLNIPYIDGKSVLYSIKRQSPKTEVIVLTGFADQETTNSLLKSGAFACLKKPLNLEQMIKTLADVREKMQNLDAQVQPVVLLAIDSDERRSTIEKILSRHGIKTVFYEDTSDCSAVLSKEGIDLVLMEFNHHKDEQLQTFMQLKKSYEDFELVLLLTEHGDTETLAQNAIGQGAADCLSEPLDEEELLPALMKVFQNLQVQRSLLYKRLKQGHSHALSISLNDRHEVVVDLNNHSNDFIESMISTVHHLPLAFVVMNDAMDVVYSSARMSDLVSFAPKKIDTPLFEALRKQGIDLPPIDEFYKNLTKIVQPGYSDEEMTDMREYSEMGFIKLKVFARTQDPQSLIVIVFSTMTNDMLTNIHPTLGNALLKNPGY